MPNENIENPSQEIILLSDNMFDYIVRLLGWAVEVEGGWGYGIVTPSTIPCLEKKQLLRRKTYHSISASAYVEAAKKCAKIGGKLLDTDEPFTFTHDHEKDMDFTSKNFKHLNFK